MALTNKKLIGVRDPLGIRPLVLGDLNGKPVFASETRALDMVGANPGDPIELPRTAWASSDTEMDGSWAFWAVTVMLFHGVNSPFHCSSWA